MTDARQSRKEGVGWKIAGSVVLCVGLGLVVLSGASVVKQLWFVEDAVELEAPGRYLVKAASASTWTLLQELSPSGELSPVSVKVRALDGRDVVVSTSAAAYPYSRDGVRGFSAYDFAVPGAGEYEVALSSSAGVTLRLIDDVGGRLSDARRGMVRTAALFGGALALSLAMFALALLSPSRRPRPRVVAPKARVTSHARPRHVSPARSLQVLPALPTSIALERYGLPAPKKPGAARARVRPDTAQVPSVA